LDALGGLDCRLATIAVAYVVEVLLLLDEEPFLPEALEDPFAAREPIHPRERPGLLRHLPGIVDHPHGGEVVPPGHLEVIRVMGRSDLHCAGPEFGVDHLVGEQRDGAVHKGKAERRADPARVSFVLRVDGDCGVPQHRFGAGRGDQHAPASRELGVPDVVQSPLRLHVGDLEVGERRVAPWAPVDDIATAVDKPLLVKPYERLPYRAG
jgi:hypothetical protein